MHTPRFSAGLVLFRAACVALAALASSIANAQNEAAEKERELLAVLRSDAPKADKALACKRLAVYGSSESVSELANLLSDEQLASWARIALEAIPGPAADEALRNALDMLQGRLLVGAINSLGVRRDVKAVAALARKLDDSNADAASAAAAALGRIATDDATKRLRQSLAAAPDKVRSSIAEGLVLCAERLTSEGRQAEAIEIYDQVRKADLPKQRRLEATRGAILARKQEGIPLLLEQFRSPDKAFFQLALGVAREFPGAEIDQALARELAGTTPERAALLIVAMADRRETVVLSAILKAAAAGPPEVRLAALGALGRIGNASCLPSLLEIAIESDGELTQAAKGALAELPDAQANQEIVARLADARGKTYALLLELVGLRRIAAVDLLVKALDNSDPAIRSAALTSLGATVSARQLGLLVSQAVAPNHAADAATARLALKAAAVRMPDRDACAAELAAAMADSPTETKVAFLEILGAVGGTKALAALGAAAKSDDVALQDASTRLLGEWMTADAAPVLLELAKRSGDKFQARALRAYLRIARQFVLPEPQRMEICRNALALSRQPAEVKLVLEVLKRHPSQESLKLAVEIMQTPEVKQEAADTAWAIGQKIGGKSEEARKILSQAGLDGKKPD